MITLAQYVITDGSRWIMRNRNGKYVPTSCEALADIFSNKAANNLTDALHRKEELCEELSFVDRELSDINHYIEFCNLNAAQGWKAYKMIKERRIKRRSIKNEIQILNIILDKKISDTVTNEILESMSKMDKRTYEPRVMNELFDL